MIRAICYEYILNLIKQKENFVHVQVQKQIFSINIKKLHILKMESHSPIYMSNFSATKRRDKQNAIHARTHKNCTTA
jgi:hypothetical protein